MTTDPPPRATPNPDGCPCDGDCCDSPDVDWIDTSDHPDDCACDDHWSRRCANCGSICRCEV